MKTIKKIILGISVLAILTVAILVLLSSNRLEIGYQAFRVLSGSMIPTLHIDDLVISKSVQEEEIKKGDIITFSDGDSIVTHRIIEISKVDGEKHYITKGDNNNTKDDHQRVYRDIKGKVVLILPKAGMIVNLLQKKESLILLMVFIFGFCLLEYRRD